MDRLLYRQDIGKVGINSPCSWAATVTDLNIYSVVIDSIKTTSMENFSTRVLEKIKNI